MMRQSSATAWIPATLWISCSAAGIGFAGFAVVAVDADVCAAAAAMPVASARVAAPVGVPFAVTVAARAQADTPARAQAAAQSEDHDDGLVREAAERLRAWIAEGSPPEREAAGAQDLASAPLPGTGLAVTIRVTGRVAGTAWELSPPDGVRGVADQTQNEARLRGLTIRAIAAAMDDPMLRMAQERLRLSVGQSFHAELEVAGALQALAGRTWARLAAQIGPSDGVALVHGERMATMFPSRIRAMNAADRLEQVLPSLAVELGLPPHDLATLRQTHAVRVFRFSAMHLVQPAPMRPFLPTRGGHVLVPEAEPNALGDPAWFGDRLIDHVLTRLRTDDELIGLMGDYRPSADVHEPLHATRRDHALIALGLARLAAYEGFPQWQRTRLEAAADILLLAYADMSRGAADGRRDPVALSAFLLAFDARPALREHRLLRAIAMEAATVLAQAAASGQMPPRGHSAAVAAAGLAAAARVFPSVVSAEQAEHVFDALLAATDAGGFADLLPWAGEMLLDRYERQRSPEDAALLRDAVLALRAVQVGEDVRDSVAQGGLNFAGGGAVTVDAQSLRAGILLARIAGSAAVQDTLPPVHLEAIAGTRAMTRFVRQLAVRDEDLWAFRSPHRSIGGIRASLTSSDQPVAAQAMGLLYVAALLDMDDRTAVRPR